MPGSIQYSITLYASVEMNSTYAAAGNQRKQVLHSYVWNIILGHRLQIQHVLCVAINPVPRFNGEL